MNSSTSESAGVLEPATAPAARDARGQPPPAPPLPQEPLVVIEPSGPWAALRLRDLWAYRELLYFLVWRDLKVRYKQTAFGVAWVVLQPLSMTLVFTIFLGRLVNVASDGVPYPVFAYAGLLPWTFFAGAVAATGNSLVGNAHLITKVYFPRMIIPAAAVGARLIDLGIAFGVLLGMMIYYRVGATWNLLMIVPLVALLTLLALGCGMWASALNVKYRDVGVALPVVIQLWMFASPVVYSPSLVPAEWRWAYQLNPLVGFLNNFRAALFGLEFQWAPLCYSAAFTLVLLVYAAYAFRRREKTFADIV